MVRILVGSLLILVFVLSAAALSARNSLDLPATPYRYANVELPPHVTPTGRKHDNTPRDNPLSDDGATLGRVLFHDTRLSANETTSCASCHVQAHAFSDPKPFSRGFHGALTDRRSMPLVNVRYYQRARFFWDERAGNLEEMVLLPIQSRIEMGQDLKQVVDTLGRDARYRMLFARAFGTTQITERRIGKALAQFVRSLVSYQSRYDEGRVHAGSAQDDFDNFTRQENRGKALFLRNCSSCHMKDGNEHFFVPIPANTGLRGRDPAADGGVGDVTLQAADLGSFKSPSLRNVEVTAPYGHDGRFATLDALIDHYSENPISDPSLGYMVPAGPMKFTASEKAALIAFLKTLTDRTFLTDARFSNPFVNRKDSAVTRIKPAVLRAGATVMASGAALVQAVAGLRSGVLAVEVPPVPVAPLAPLAPLAPPEKSSHPIIHRLTSFDVSADHRISRHELPERMQGLVGRGDRDADAALDPKELRILVNAATSQRTRVAFSPHSFEGLPGVIKDLKLQPVKHAAALAIVSTHMRTGSSRDAEMRAVLDGEEYGNFVAAVARLSSRRAQINK